MKIFEREIRVSVEMDESGFQIKSHLIDNNHDMQVDVLVEQETMQIKAVDGQMERVPYAVCQNPLQGLNVLVGLHVKPGINRIVRDLIGGTKGCVHIVELLQECFKAALQGNICLVVNQLTGEERTKKLEQMLKNQCLRYTEEYSSTELQLQLKENLG